MHVRGHREVIAARVQDGEPLRSIWRDLSSDICTYRAFTRQWAVMAAQEPPPAPPISETTPTDADRSGPAALPSRRTDFVFDPTKYDREQLTGVKDD